MRKLYVMDHFQMSMLNRNSQSGTPAGYTPRTGDGSMEVARVMRPVDDPREFLSVFVLCGVYEIIPVVELELSATNFTQILNHQIDVRQGVTVRLQPGDNSLIGHLVDGKYEWWCL